MTQQEQITHLTRQVVEGANQIQIRDRQIANLQIGLYLLAITVCGLLMIIIF